MEAKNYSFVGAGVPYMRPYGATGAWVDRGNASQLNLSVEENEITQPNYRGGGGNRDVTRRPSSVGISLTLTDMSPQNFELGTRGTLTEVSAGTVTGEEHTAYVGAPTPLDYLPDISDTQASVTVTLDPGGTAQALTEGTDYRVTKSSIVPIEGGAISDGDTIGVDYTKDAQAIVEALMIAASEIELFLDGLNDAKSGDPVTVHIKRAKFGAASELAFISDEYGNLQLEGDVLAADNVAAGESPFYTIKMKTAA